MLGASWLRVLAMLQAEARVAAAETGWDGSVMTTLALERLLLCKDSIINDVQLPIWQCGCEVYIRTVK